MNSYITILFSGYSTMPCAPASFRRGMIERTVASSRIVLSASQSPSLKGRNGRLLQRRQHAQHAFQVLLFHIEHQPDLAQRVDGAIQQHPHIFQLAPLPRILPRIHVGDELRIRFHHGLDDPQFVGAQGRACFGNFDDRIRELGRLHLGRTPTEFDFGGDAVGFQITFGGRHQLGRDDLAFEILDRLHG